MGTYCTVFSTLFLLNFSIIKSSVCLVLIIEKIQNQHLGCESTQLWAGGE